MLRILNALYCYSFIILNIIRPFRIGFFFSNNNSKNVLLCFKTDRHKILILY